MSAESLESIIRSEVSVYVSTNNSYPKPIIVHPRTFAMLLEQCRVKNIFPWDFPKAHEVFKFLGIEMYRSEDMEIGKFIIL